MKRVLLSVALLTVAGALSATCSYTKSCNLSGECDGRKVETRCDSCPCKDNEANKSGSECCKEECLCDEEIKCATCGGQKEEPQVTVHDACADCNDAEIEDCGDCSAE
ncbi:MAG TPA: hypothetical protein PLU71_03095 [Candidatus Dependentiae bacterium]|nr:hypothetical protein [Candidatus Dependentiae bacterium]HRQ62818.1 hypothetical protein [Candidatus Dependentiae bacterium]